MVRQLRPFCTMLDIKRQDGRNQPFEVETVSHRKLIWNPDGSLTISQPTFDERTVDGKSHITIHARSMSEFRTMLFGRTRKHPILNFDKLMSQASITQESLQEPIQMSHIFGSELAGRSIIKSCLALAYKSCLSIDDCKNAKDYLLGDGEECFGYYNDTDSMKNRSSNSILHCIYVCADSENGLILAYAEYFGFQKIIACLSNNYNSPARENCYAINTLTGEEIDVSIFLNITQDQIREIYDGKRTNDQRVKVDLENLLTTWRKIDQDRAINRVAEDAMIYACAQCGLLSEELIPENMIPQLTVYFFRIIAPFLFQSKLGRSLTTVEEEAIAEMLGPPVEAKETKWK